MWLVPVSSPHGDPGSRRDPLSTWPKGGLPEKGDSQVKPGGPRGDRPRRGEGAETQKSGSTEGNDPTGSVVVRCRDIGDWVGHEAGEGWAGVWWYLEQSEGIWSLSGFEGDAGGN